MLRNIFQYYDSVKFLDMVQLLRLHSDYHLKPWLKSLGSVSGLKLEEKQITFKYIDIAPYIEEIIQSYEKYSFTEQLS